MSMQTILVSIVVTALVSGGIVALALLRSRGRGRKALSEREYGEPQSGMSMGARLLGDGSGSGRGSGGEEGDAYYELTSVELGSQSGSVSYDPTDPTLSSDELSNQWSNNQWSNTGVHGSRDGVPGDAVELTYASWGKSNAQLMVLDHELRIVLWSRGLVEAAFGLEPEIGTSLEALPFPSSEHRARAVASLEGVMGEASAARSSTQTARYWPRHTPNPT
jgi:hypothetical protein